MENIFDDYKAFKSHYGDNSYHTLLMFSIIDEFEAVGVVPTLDDIELIYTRYMSDDTLNSPIVLLIDDYLNEKR